MAVSSSNLNMQKRLHLFIYLFATTEIQQSQQDTQIRNYKLLVATGHKVSYVTPHSSN